MDLCRQLLIGMVVLSTTSVRGDDHRPLRQLIAAVARNEAHYQNLDLELTSVYSSENAVITEPAPKGQDAFQETMVSRTEMSITLMGERFRRHETTTSFTLPDTSTSETIDVFDGQTRQQFWAIRSNEIGTGQEHRSKSGGIVSNEWPRLTNLARPHMFLIESGCPNVPLSVYMRGHDAVVAQPNPGHHNAGLRITDLGTQEFQMLTCRRVLIDGLSQDGARYNSWELWLAEERNLIPVRNVAYTYRDSIDIPVAESIVDEWKELRPGVWFPVKAHTDRYDSQIIKAQGKQQLSWRMEYEVQHVSLEPDVTDETFTKLDFPPGTKVRTIDNGKVSEREQ